MNTTWRGLNKGLSLLDEAQVLALLETERATTKRVATLIRLHAKYSALRTTRERIEILTEATK